MARSGPWKLYRVVDIGPRIASAFAARYLAELGADVVRVEPPEPDAIRSAPPFLGAASLETSALHHYVNGGKRSVVLDSSPSGQDALKKLLNAADVVINGHDSSTSEQMGIDEDALSAGGSHAILIDVSTFGRSGPYSTFLGEEIVAAALGGIMHVTGDPEREPLKPFGHLIEYQLGLNAVLAASVALFGYMAGRSPIQAADVSAMETSVTVLENSIGLYLRGGVVRGRNNNSFYTGAPFLDVYQCRDGFITITIGSQTHWEMVCAVIGRPEWVDDPTMADWSRRTVRAAEIRDAIQAWCEPRDKMDVFHSFQAVRMAVAPGYSLNEVLSDPQNTARDYFTEVDHPVVGLLKTPRPPFHASGFAFSAAPAPLLGAHTDEVLTEWTQP